MTEDSLQTGFYEVPTGATLDQVADKLVHLATERGVVMVGKHNSLLMRAEPGMTSEQVRKQYVDKEWVPIRKGWLYCSPACGCRCTWASYRQAVKDAMQLVKMLQGSEWKAAVWENLGWHFNASAGPLVVTGDRHTSDGSPRYSCSMKGITPGNFTSPDPNEVLRNTVIYCIRGASKGLTELFQATQSADMISLFNRELIHHEAIWQLVVESSMLIRFTHST